MPANVQIAARLIYVFYAVYKVYILIEIVSVITPAYSTKSIDKH
jgi:hypothetical protein